ncbi:hypothetical protein [uncultured Bartonella sp.]|uniref:hypothetical protein n=1 Tax=uncultured Bartonella sp. TaxID=104108 RepID=UPI0025D069E2|nr:hypothetical protein [uncultured Bartonella sp.]
MFVLSVMFVVKKHFIVWLDDFTTEQFLPLNVDVIMLKVSAHQAKNPEGYFAFHLSIALFGTLRYERDEDQRRV